MPAKQSQPIDLYFWNTPNGFKISIAIEELGVAYATHFVNIGKGDQFNPEFLAISPNNRIPAIVDPEGPDGAPISIFESGAILIYLGEKFGGIYPADARGRVAVNEWLIWQVANVGPIFGQNNHFRNYSKEKLPYAITRFVDETHRLYGVLERRLRAATSWPAAIQSPTSPRSAGSGAGTAAASTSPSSRTSRPGTTASRRGLRSSAAWR